MDEAQNKQTTVDGVRAIELFYRSIKEAGTGDTVFFQSQMRFNAPSMGVLPPARYAAVLERSTQAVQIFQLTFRQFLRALNKFSERGVQYDWISLYMPVRCLLVPGCVQELSELCRKALIRPERVCFELSPVLLAEVAGMASLVIRDLRQADFHVMLNGIGGSASTLRLGEFEADYFMLHPDAMRITEDNERGLACLRSVVSLINELDGDAIGCDLTEKPQLQLLRSVDCTYYTGDLSGTFMAEQYMRARNSNESGSEETSG